MAEAAADSGGSPEGVASSTSSLAQTGRGTFTNVNVGLIQVYFIILIHFTSYDSEQYFLSSIKAQLCSKRF